MSLAFDGLLKSCIEYKKVKGGLLRCAQFEKGRAYPVCPEETAGRPLKHGGRSQNYIRAGTKGCIGVINTKYKRNKAKAETTTPKKLKKTDKKK